MYIDLGGQGGGAQSYDYQQHHQPQHAEYGKPHYETAYPMGNAPQYGYAQAAGGYPGAQPQGGMQYGGQQHRPPQQQMDHQEPEEKKESKCCGLCVVM